MPKRCIIISGGERSEITGINEGDFIIACDRGYEYAVNAHIVPDLAVGDFDSFSGKIEPGTVIREYPSEKDDTDTMIAVRYAVEHGFEEIAMFCALGGRLDHTYATFKRLLMRQRTDLWLLYMTAVQLYIPCIMEACDCQSVTAIPYPCSPIQIAAKM